MSRQLPLFVEPEPPPRSECRDGPRPCPHYQCRHHLWAVEARAGRRQRADETTWRSAPTPVVLQHSPETCALDQVDAEPDGLDREKVGKLLGLTRERVRQIEEAVVEKLRRRRALDDEA